MKSILVILGLMGFAASAAPAAQPPVDVCKTYFTCGTYSGLGDSNSGKPAKVTYTITVASAAAGEADVRIQTDAKPYPFDFNIKMLFQTDGRITLMAGKDLVGAGMCQDHLCSFAVVTDSTDNESTQFAMMRFADNKMEFLFEVGTPASLTPQMQAVIPKIK